MLQLFNTTNLYIFWGYDQCFRLKHYTEQGVETLPDASFLQYFFIRCHSKLRLSLCFFLWREGSLFMI